jgi:hypothetical protein
VDARLDQEPLHPVHVLGMELEAGHEDLHVVVVFLEGMTTTLARLVDKMLESSKPYSLNSTLLC